MDGKKMLRFVVRFTLAVSVVACLILTAWGWDVHNDRKHVVTVISKTPVFAGDDWCHDGQRLMDVAPGIHLGVRRIRYWKDCATLDVALPDGREGYLVFGVGTFSVSPPLGD